MCWTPGSFRIFLPIFRARLCLLFLIAELLMICSCRFSSALCPLTISGWPTVVDQQSYPLTLVSLSLFEREFPHLLLALRLHLVILL